MKLQERDLELNLSDDDVKLLQVELRQLGFVKMVLLDQVGASWDSIGEEQV